MAARSATAATCLSAPGSAPADPSPAPSTALGTGEGPLRYRICVPCSKRPPPVRDAFSEARRTKNPLLRYGRDIRYQKQLPVVRDASSEAFGVKNRLFWYGRDIRYRKRPSLVYRTHLQRCAKQPPAPPNAFSKAQKRHPATLNASSKARRTADSTDCGQPTARPDAFQRRAVPKAAPAHRTHLQRRETAPALFVRSGGPFPCPFDSTRYRKQPTARR